MRAFRSPWRRRAFVAGVALLRSLLRPWPRLDQRLITRLVAAQNKRVEQHLARHGAHSVLLILPRCVKPRDCGCDVRVSLAACRACDGCQLAPLARLCEGRGVRALVSFRSHQAFALARQQRPDLIVASACHDRLVKALRSVPEIPALLHPLSGMERMCVGGRFDANWIAAQLRRATPQPSARAQAQEAG